MPNWTLFNYPDDVVCVVNGHPVTKTDILREKRTSQRNRLAHIREPDYIIRSGIISVFSLNFGKRRDLYLRVKTLKHNYPVSPIGANKDFSLPIMRMYPCGYLPIVENFNQWLVAFVGCYPRPTATHPFRGAAAAWVKVSPGGILLDISETAVFQGE